MTLKNILQKDNFTKHTVYLANVRCMFGEEHKDDSKLKVKCAHLNFPITTSGYQQNDELSIEEWLFSKQDTLDLDQVYSMWIKLQSDGNRTMNATIRKQWYRKLNKLLNKLSIESNRANHKSREQCSKYLKLIEQTPLLFNLGSTLNHGDRLQFTENGIEVHVTKLERWNQTEQSVFRESVQLRPTRSVNVPTVENLQLITTWIRSSSGRPNKTERRFWINSNIISVNVFDVQKREFVHNATVKIKFVQHLIQRIMY